jgi:DNA-binding FrmR family transcriptional regulator
MTAVFQNERKPAVRHARRATGQMAAIASMIEDDRPFSEVAQQLLAARGSLDSLLVRLVELELRGCVPGREARQEVDELLRTALGRAAPGRRALRSAPKLFRD